MSTFVTSSSAFGLCLATQNFLPFWFFLPSITTLMLIRQFSCIMICIPVNGGGKLRLAHFLDLLLIPSHFTERYYLEGSRGQTSRSNNYSHYHLFRQDPTYTFPQQIGIPRLHDHRQHSKRYMQKAFSPCPHPAWLPT